MNERIASTYEKLSEHRTIAPLERLRAYINGLTPGDRAIFYGLSALVAIVALIALYVLESHFLVAVPTYGGTLTEGEVGSPRFVNPLLAISDADRDLTALTYAGLMGLSGDGSLAPVLASSYTVSPDGKVYTFTLRKNAKFSDGTPVSADDVVFTVEKAQDPGIKSPEYADWTGITVEAIDPQTVRFTLAKPYAPFLENTALGILPAHLWRDVPDEQFPFSTLAEQPVGAGPFVYSSLSRDKTGLITNYSVRENPLYVLGRPYLAGFDFIFYSQQEDLAKALANGSVDSAYGIPRAGALTSPYSRVFGAFFNPGEDHDFLDPAVRKALSVAIDRQNIVTNVLGGYATAIMGPVPPGSGITETPVTTYPDPTAAATSILESAGWSYDGNTRAWGKGSGKTAQTLSSLTIRTSNVPELKSIASAVKADWEKLGISVDIELYEPGDLNQNVIRPRKYDVLLFGMVIGRDPDLYAFWDSQEQNDPGLNIALYANKTVDALLSDARQSVSEEQRLADLAKIDADVAADYPAAFIEAPDFIYAVPKNLGGVELPQIATPSDRFATVADWYLRTEAVWPFLVNKK